ncbi:hypothetical protein J1G42_18600 [Cellulomonas sp. zg-ZUI222]|uniref:hypothetical protein n=1 Tax=Cellulomonas wangleii TaxID=2816956 RepID=UPI001A94E99F|nr:hypothetical protein [Cellulomonas wangleii]MBO0922834.1 hypothetical protein [Cellulomonas wangleii]
MRRSTTLTTDDTRPASRRERARETRRRARRRTAATTTAVVLALIATITPAAAGARGALAGAVGLPAPEPSASAPAGGAAGSAEAPPLPRTGDARPQATIEDEEAWCSYLSSYYLAFPSPWSARVINCRHSALFVAPLYSDGSRGMCVLVPARHSRHLGGNIARWVTDIRLC